MMDGYGYGGWGWGAWLFMGFMMLIFFAVLAAVFIGLFRSGGRWPDRSGANDTDTARRLLDERFARGDIDAEEYTKRRDLLRS